MRKYHISQQQDKIPAITSHQEDTPVLTFRYPPACYFYYFAPLQNKLSLNILKHALKDIITYFLEEKEQIYLSIFKPFVFKKIEIFIFHRCSWKDFQDLLTHTHKEKTDTVDVQMGVTGLWDLLGGGEELELTDCSGETWAVDLTAWMVHAHAASFKAKGVSGEYVMMM